MKALLDRPKCILRMDDGTYSEISTLLITEFGESRARYYLNGLMGIGPDVDNPELAIKPEYVANAIILLMHFRKAETYSEIYNMALFDFTKFIVAHFSSSDPLNGAISEEMRLALDEILYYISRLPSEEPSQRVNKANTHFMEFLSRVKAIIPKGLLPKNKTTFTSVPYWVLPKFIQWLEDFLCTEGNLPKAIRDEFEIAKGVMLELLEFYTILSKYYACLDFMYGHLDRPIDEFSHNNIKNVSDKALDLLQDIRDFKAAKNITGSGHSRGAAQDGALVKPLNSKYLEANQRLGENFSECFQHENIANIIGSNFILRLLLAGIDLGKDIYTIIADLYAALDRSRHNVVYSERAGLALAEEFGEDPQERQEKIERYKLGLWCELMLKLLELLHGHKTGPILILGSEVYTTIEHMVDHLRIFNLSELSGVYLTRSAGMHKNFLLSGYCVRMSTLDNSSMDDANHKNLRNPEGIKLIEWIRGSVSKFLESISSFKEIFHRYSLKSIVLNYMMSQHSICCTNSSESAATTIADAATTTIADATSGDTSLHCGKIVLQVSNFPEVFNSDLLLNAMDTLSIPGVTDTLDDVLPERANGCISKKLASLLCILIHILKKRNYDGGDADILLLEYLLRLLCNIVLYNKQAKWHNELEDECSKELEDKKVGFLAKIFRQIAKERSACDGFFAGKFTVKEVLSMDNIMIIKSDR
uniref:Uncharacterized protein n=1 Tax=viral metagenome TaxID=1070528 RepID=A0A6C0I1F4_9ZZZZ